MNAHVRKLPERRPQGQARKGGPRGRAQPPQRRPNIVLTGLAALGGLAARNPTVVGGTCAFLVVFSFADGPHGTKSLGAAFGQEQVRFRCAPQIAPRFPAAQQSP